MRKCSWLQSVGVWGHVMTMFCNIIGFTNYSLNFHLFYTKYRHVLHCKYWLLNASLIDTPVNCNFVKLCHPHFCGYECCYLISGDCKHIQPPYYLQKWKFNFGISIYLLIANWISWTLVWPKTVNIGRNL